MVDKLLAFDHPRPTFDPGLATSLRRRMEEALAPVATGLDRPLRTSKNGLANVHTCEAYYRAEKDGFAWGTRNAVGTLTHRALRLSIALGGDQPRALREVEALVQHGARAGLVPNAVELDALRCKQGL